MTDSSSSDGKASTSDDADYVMADSSSSDGKASTSDDAGYVMADSSSSDGKAPTSDDAGYIMADSSSSDGKASTSDDADYVMANDRRQTQLFHHQPAASRLKSRKSFMRTVTPLDSSASSSRLRLWKDSLTDVPASIKMGLKVAESLPAGSEEDWLCWRALNRLRTGVGRAKTVMRKWGYLDDAQSVDCDCGEPQTMAHLLSCRLLDEACTADDLATVTERAKACA